MADVQATPGTFPGPTGIPAPVGPGQQLTKQQVMQALLKMLQTAPPGGGQPQGQPANQPTALQIGQLGGQQPPIPFSTAGAPTMPAAPSGMRPQAQQVPMPQNLGQEFGTKAGAVNATVKETIGGIAEFLNAYKGKKQQDETIKAENYFSQIMAASQNPSDPQNKKILDVLGSDPKVLKTIEEGMKYTFAREPTEAEPEPPASKGMKAAFQKLVGKQQGPPMPAKLPPPGQPGGIMLPGPTQQQQLAASQTNAQLSGMQQSPDVRAAVAGTGLPPAEMQVLDQNARIQAGHDYAKYLVVLEQSQREARKSEADYQKQMLANKGRVDAGIAIARINAQARVQAAQIQAQASMMRITGRAPKMPGVAIQTKFDAMNRAQHSLDYIMAGHDDQVSYQHFVADLKAAGLTGVMAEVPGQSGSPAAKMFGGYKDSDAKWKTVQKGLGDTIKTFQTALQTSYPDWTPAGAKPGAAAAPADEGESITVTPEELEEDEKVSESGEEQ